ncbi:hypothetical protein GCM10027444_38740 [Actinopolyspora lacussalsi]
MATPAFGSANLASSPSTSSGSVSVTPSPLLASSGDSIGHTAVIGTEILHSERSRTLAPAVFHSPDGPKVGTWDDSGAGTPDRPPEPWRHQVPTHR